MLFKLDGGLDHILVDEAQDTNPEQWEVVQRSPRNSSPAKARVDAEPHVFAVGDAKQSIFGFQRADPRSSWHARAFRAAA